MLQQLREMRRTIRDAPITAIEDWGIRTLVNCFATLREFCADIVPALCLSTPIEGVFITTFLVGVFVAFALAVSP